MIRSRAPLPLLAVTAIAVAVAGGRDVRGRAAPPARLPRPSRSREGSSRAYPGRIPLTVFKGIPFAAPPVGPTAVARASAARSLAGRPQGGDLLGQLYPVDRQRAETVDARVHGARGGG